jgi:hypothetical protein
MATRGSRLSPILIKPPLKLPSGLPAQLVRFHVAIRPLSSGQGAIKLYRTCHAQHKTTVDKHGAFQAVALQPPTHRQRVIRVSRIEQFEELLFGHILPEIKRRVARERLLAPQPRENRVVFAYFMSHPSLPCEIPSRLHLLYYRRLMTFLLRKYKQNLHVDGRRFRLPRVE